MAGETQGKNASPITEEEAAEKLFGLAEQFVDGITRAAGALERIAAVMESGGEDEGEKPMFPNLGVPDDNA